MPLSEVSYYGLGRVPVGIGAVPAGWDLIEREYRRCDCLGIVDFRAMAPECQLKCFDCFAKGERTLSLKETERAIHHLYADGAQCINFIGEGEPMLDPWFLPIIKMVNDRRMTPVVFTNGIELQTVFAARAMYHLGITVFPKCDSLFRPDYQSWKVGSSNFKYYGQMRDALDNLMKAELNEINIAGTTRLGIDVVITSRNIDEIPATLRWCRKRNIFVMFSRWLPAGNCIRPDFDNSLAVTKEEMAAAGETVQQIDREEFGFDHPAFSNFLTFPCVERLQILGNGNVTPCPGNETILGNILKHPHPIVLLEKLIAQFPCFNPKTFDGNCWCRK